MKVWYKTFTGIVLMCLSSVVKAQFHFACIFSVCPYRLCRRAVEVGGVDLVAHARYYLHYAYACFGQGVEQLVAAVARLVDTDVVAVCAGLKGNRAELGLKLHPLYAGEIALEFGIEEALARYGVVVFVAPDAELRTVQAVPSC